MSDNNKANVVLQVGTKDLVLEEETTINSAVFVEDDDCVSEVPSRTSLRAAEYAQIPNDDNDDNDVDPRDDSSTEKGKLRVCRKLSSSAEGGQNDGDGDVMNLIIQKRAMMLAPDHEEEADEDEVAQEEEESEDNDNSPTVRPGAYSGAPGVHPERRDTLRFSLVGAQPLVQGSSTAISLDDEPADQHQEQEGQQNTAIATSSEHKRLAKARPVHEDSILQVDSEAQPVDLEATNKKREATDAQQKRRFVIVSTMALVIVVVAVVVLGLVLSNNNNNKDSASSAGYSNGLSSSTTTPSLPNTTMVPPSSAPSAIAAPSISLLMDSLLLANPPNSTLVGLKKGDPNSPQTKAIHWLLQHQNFTTLLEQEEDWRIIQLFALATIYYSLDGPNWLHGIAEDWLDDTKSECLWFSAKQQSFGDLTGAFQGIQGNRSCNDEGQFQILNLYEVIDPHPHHDDTIPQQLISFPPEIALLSNLVELELSGAGLNVSFEADVWPIISSLSNLQVLGLSSNSIRGTIPSEIGITLPNLTYLHLGFNELSGTIPTELALLTNLSSLNLPWNLDLGGSIPTQIGQLATKLLELDLDNCNLMGTIPTQLGLLSNLPGLNLGFNKLSGSLPTQLGLLTQLENFFVDQNYHLSGTIPSELGRITNTALFLLSNNNFTGPIPSQLGLLTSMSWLDLSDNALSNHIPAQLGVLMSTILTRIDLHNNLLSGPIPTFGTNGSVSHLNNNHSSGNATDTTTDNNTPDLNLSPLDLDGWYEPDYLHMLDISNNPMLSGTIPNHLCSMNDRSYCTFYEFDEILDSWTIQPCVFAFDCSNLLCGCHDCPCSTTTSTHHNNQSSHNNI